MRVLRSVSRWALLVCWIIEVILYAWPPLRVRFSELIFLSLLALLVAWLRVFQ
jgi:hypothetical protein